VYHDYANISVAVATPKVSLTLFMLVCACHGVPLTHAPSQGLVVPVIQDVQDMSYVDIERAITAMGQKVRIYPAHGQPSLPLSSLQASMYPTPPDAPPSLGS